jgi:hypothetical protein
VHLRRHDQPVYVELFVILAPSRRPDESAVDEGRQPQQRSRPKIFDILVQGRYPVVIDQGGLKRIGRVLDSEQGPGQLRIGAGSHLKNAHVLSLTGRGPSQCSSRMTNRDRAIRPSSLCFRDQDRRRSAGDRQLGRQRGVR